MFELLYEAEGNIIARNEKGQLTKIPKNKFNDGEIVTTSKRHFSEKALGILTKPTYTENRGWVYIENYIDLQGSGGGCGSWFEEELYEKIDDPILKLFAERIRLRKHMETLKCQLKNDSEQLEKIRYSLSISVDYFNEVKRACNKCSSVFIKNAKNINSNICDDCDVTT